MTVPTAGHASINLAQTVVVLGYVWHRTVTSGPAWMPSGAASAEAASAGVATPPGSATAPGDLPADRGQIEAMFGQQRAVLRRIGYTDAPRETHVLRRYRSLLARAAPTADEVTLLRGLWYQLAWAVEQVPERLPGPRLRGWEDAPDAPPPAGSEPTEG